MSKITSSSVKDTPSTRSNRICSVPQCSNRANRVTGISLHSFPKRAALRKKWGIIFRFGKDIPLYAVACSEHFSSEAFMIQQPNVLRRRLKANALPSEKIPLRSLDTPKISASGKRRNERAREVCCSAYGCSNRADYKKPGVSFHRFPNDSERRAAWIKAVWRKNWAPSIKSVLCSDHFLPKDMDRTSISNVRLRDSAVPSVFPGHPPRLQNSEETQLKIGNNNAPIPGDSRSTSDALHATAKSSVKLRVKRGMPAPQNFPDMEGDDSIGHLDIGDAFSPSACVSNFSKRLLMEPSVFEMLLVDENILSLPVTWGRNIPLYGPRVIMYTQLITIEEEDHIRPVFYKELCVLESGRVTCSVIGCRLKRELFWLPEGPLESCKQLENILMRLDALEECEGISEIEAVECDQQSCFQDCLGNWRHKKCLIVPNANGICAVCYPVISSWQSKQLS